MIQKFYTLKIETSGQKLYEFTKKTIAWIKSSNFNNGIINILDVIEIINIVLNQ